MRKNRSEKLLILLIIAITLIASIVIAADPVGSIDAVTPSSASGWVSDPDTPNDPTWVHFYIDGQSGQGRWVGGMLADEYRSDIGYHAYNYSLPQMVRDGENHWLYAYGINTGTGNHPLLYGAPAYVMGDRTQVWLTSKDAVDLAFSNDWQYVAQNVDVIELLPYYMKEASVTELQALVNKCIPYDIKFAVEMSGLHDSFAPLGSQSGEAAAQWEINEFKKFTDPPSLGGAGGTITYFNFDGPIRRMLYPDPDPNNGQVQYHTIQSAATELADAMQLYLAAYPHVKFIYLVNFPSWGWKGEFAYNNLGYSAGAMGYGDFYNVITTVLNTAASRGLTFYGICADQPYDYTNKSHSSNQWNLIQNYDFWSRLRDLEQFTESGGMRFHLIYNDEGASLTGGNQDFYVKTMNYIADYHNHFGTPWAYVIETWNDYPDTLLPETTPFTLTNLVKNAIPVTKTWSWSVGSPVGRVTASNANVISGYAWDNDSPSSQLYIHFYMDGHPGAGSYIGWALADQYVSGIGNHGFNFTVPTSAIGHEIYVYAINASGTPGDHPLLRDSPSFAQ